ncbi:MAG: EamA family transporter RarD [Pseudomonadota bacterium]
MTQEIRLGLLAGVGAYTIWGLLPLYFRALGHVSPEEMLAHRIIWALPAGVALIAIAARWRDLRAACTPSRLGWLGLAAALIGLNWFVYIWAVGQERVMEASLGYYINPLVNVVLGAAFLSERLRPAQWVAVGLAALGVALMAGALGQVPWVALILCFTFAFYSLIRKRVAVDGRAGFVVEAAFLFPFATLWMGLHLASGGPLWGAGGWDVPLLLAAGPITAAPLILFAVSAKRLRLSTIGMMQYLGPTLQFLIALAFGERFGWTHAAAFGFIWLALAVFTADSVAGARRRPKTLESAA